MTISGGSNKTGAQLNARDVRELVSAARSVQSSQTEGGIESQTGRDAQYFTISAQIANQDNIRESFLGVVMEDGPPLEEGQTRPDLEGSMYWVKEVRDTSESIDRLVMKTIEQIYPAGSAPTPEQNAQILDWHKSTRWLPAANISEMDVDDPDADTHGVSVGTVVKVFVTKTADGTPRFYFSESRGMGQFAFAVVREIPENANSYLVKAQEVQLNAGDALLVGAAQDIQTYPGIPARYYAPLVWKGSVTIFEGGKVFNPAVPLLRVFIANGEFYLEQSVRWPLRKSSGGINLSDCTPVEVVT